MCYGCFGGVMTGLSELEKVRREASAYARTTRTDVVVVMLDGKPSFHLEDFIPEGAARVEVITEYYV
jgi:hypothetical protein